MNSQLLDISSLNNEAACLSEDGYIDEAIKLLLSTLAAASKHPRQYNDLGILTGEIAYCMKVSEDFHLPEQTVKFAYNAYKAELPQSSTTLDLGNILATIYENTQRLEEALRLYRDIADVCLKYYPNTNSTATSLNNLANVYETLEMYSEAESLYLNSLTILHESDDKGIKTAEVLTNIGYLKKKLRDYSGAIKNYQEAFNLIGNSDNPSWRIKAITIAFNLSRAFEETGDHESAKKWCALGLEMSEGLLDPEHSLLQALHDQKSDLESVVSDKASNLHNNCNECGTNNSVDSKFCTNCGTKISRACPSCNAVANIGANFCRNCGIRL